MAPVEITEDYYAVLQIRQTASAEDITKSYRRLARNVHPDRNNGCINATAAFQVLQNAYETLNDPAKRQAYDKDWPRIRAQKEAEAEAKRKVEAEKEKHRRKAEEEKARKAAEEKERQTRKAEEDKAAKERKAQIDLYAAWVVENVRLSRDERLEKLHALRRQVDSDIFNLNRAVRRLEVDLKRLAVENEQNRTAPTEQDDQLAWERRALQRLAARKIKETEIREKKKKLQRLQAELRGAEVLIAAEQEAEERQKRDEALKEQQRLRMRERESQLRQQQQCEELGRKMEELRIREAQEKAKRVAEQRKQEETTRTLLEMQRQEQLRQLEEELHKQQELQRRTQERILQMRLEQQQALLRRAEVERPQEEKFRKGWEQQRRMNQGSFSSQQSFQQHLAKGMAGSAVPLRAHNFCTGKPIWELAGGF